MLTPFKLVPIGTKARMLLIRATGIKGERLGITWKVEERNHRYMGHVTTEPVASDGAESSTVEGQL